MSTTPAPTPLPSRNDRKAPSFDGKPPSLERYFEDVDEAIDKAQLATDPEKKKAYTRYLSVIDEELWTNEAAFGDIAVSVEDFKKAIRLLYPGAKSEDRYNSTDLVRIAQKRLLTGLAMRSDLGEYWRDFTRVANVLLKQGEVSKAEVSRTFLDGFSGSMAIAITRRLEIVCPKIRPSQAYALTDIHAAADHCMDGRDATQLSGSAPSATPVKSEPTDAMLTFMQAQTAALQTQGAQQALMMRQMMDMLHNKTPGGNYPAAPVFNVQPVHQQQGGGYQGQPRYNGPQSPLTCHFCSEVGHILRVCPHFEDYLRRGLCSRDFTGRVALADGQPLPTGLWGKNFKERIDYFLTSNRTPVPNANATQPRPDAPRRYDQGPTLASYPPNPTPPPSAEPQIMSIIELCDEEEAVQFQLEEHGHLLDLSKDELANRILVLENEKAQAAGKGKQRERMDFVAMPSREELRARRAAEAAQTKKADAARTKEAATNTEGQEESEAIASGSGKPADGPKASNIPAAPESKASGSKDTAPPVPDKDGRPLPDLPANEAQAAPPPVPARPGRAPQSKLQAAVEDPAAANQLVDRIMAQTVELTMGQLMAVSPEVRIIMRQRTTQRRVPLSMSYNDHVTEELLVEQLSPRLRAEAEGATFQMTTAGRVAAQPARPLRCFYVRINGKHFECTVDTGSSIVAIKRDFWLAMGRSSDPARGILMESADEARTGTLGLVPDLEMEVRPGVVFTIQAQVVDKGPFEILLGAPFFEFVCADFHYRHGGMSLTLSEHNSGALVTLPTRERLPTVHRRRTPDEPVPSDACF